MAGSVLIIDAEEDFANELAAMLREEGIEPVVTGDGKVGLDLARINLPSAIVLCVELPRMSGYSICAKLKKDATLKGVPLIITSAEATPETFEHHKKLKTRAEEYLKKPFQPSQLFQVLSQYVSYRAGGAAPAPKPLPVMEAMPAEDLSMDDGAPQMLSDDEAFSAEEASSMEDEAADNRNMSAIDEVLSDLSRPSGNSRGSSLDLAQAAGGSEPGFEADDEMMTTVGVLPPSASAARDAERDRDRAREREQDREREQELSGEVARLKLELETAKADKARAERERAAAERAAAASSSSSQVPQASGGAQVVALKKELNQKERDFLELKEQINQKDRDVLQLRDREAELETQIVQLEDERNGVEAEKRNAEARAERAEASEAEAAERARSAEAKAAQADAKATQADAKSAAAETKATVAEQRAKDAERKALAADGKAAQANQRAKEAEQKAQTAEESARVAEARAQDIEAESRRTAEDLHQRLGEATAREADLDAALASMTTEAEGLRQQVAQLEAILTERDEDIQTLHATNGEQAAEVGRLSNELEAMAREAENLREHLAASEARLEESQTRSSNLEVELSSARNEIDANGAAIRQLEQDREVAEGRVARAYQKIRDDDKIKGKAKKALEIALALLQEAGYAADAEAPATETGDIGDARS